MAKSKSGGTRALLRGRVASDVYSIGKDAKGKKQQVVRSLAESVANPQTLAQMRGRMIMSTVMQGVSAMSAIVDHSFDAYPAGQPNISEFIRVNYALVKADVLANPAQNNVFGLNKYGEKGVKQGAYVVAAGSAADLAGAVLDGAEKTLSIQLSAGATIADLRTALGLGVDDYFTAVAVTSDSKFVYIRFHVSSTLPSATVISADNIADIIKTDGNISATLAFASNAITATLSVFSANAGIIVSRKKDASYIHNNVQLAAVASPQYTSDDALPTYPTGSQRFLNGGGESEGQVTPEPDPDPIALSNIMYGTTSKTIGEDISLATDGNNKAITLDAANVSANGGAKIQLSDSRTTLSNPTDLITLADGANTINARTYSPATSIWLVPNSGEATLLFTIIEGGD